MKRNKGITLVALIITIIIMFILIGVSINLVIHTDLFGSAKRAKDKTEQAYKDESNFSGSFNVDGVPQNSIENYVQATCDHTWSEWEVTKEPTCTEEGSKRRSCPRCEKVEVETIDKLGHDWDSSTGTCKECGAECSHDWGEWQTITEATCTVAGIKKRTCNICKKNEMGTIPMLGHNYSNGTCTRCEAPCPHDWEEWVVEIPETCTTEGTKSKTCKICGQKETESIPAKGHNWDPITGTCTNCETACSHNWGEWKTTKEPTCTVEGTKQRTCSICNKVETGSIPVIGHNWNASTGTCTNCGTACSHNWSEWQTVTPATCTIAGSQKRTCSICKKNENKALAILGHNYGGWITTTAATCTAAGVQTKTCSRCSDKQTQSIPALGHSWNASTGTCTRCGTACTHTWSSWTTTTAATCTAAGSQKRTCSVCKKEETQSLPALGHSWNASTGTCTRCGTTCSHTWSSWTTTTAATCTAAGSQKRTCSVCKKEETQSLSALGHNWNASTGTCSRCGTSCSHSYGAYTTTTSATCTASGSKYRNCNICGYKQTTTISKLGHSMGGWYTYKAATCTTAGRKDNDCQRSGCSYYETQTISALGHSYGSWTTTTAATCTSSGSKKRTCTRSGCSSTETETIAALGHSYGSWSTTTAATCTSSGSQKRTCSRCSNSETQSIAALGHSWSSSTGKCTRCGTSCSHTYGSYTTSTAATCTVAGSKYRTCSKCKYKEVQSIPKLGHNFSNGSCTRCGTACTSDRIGTYCESGSCGDRVRFGRECKDCGAREQDGTWEWHPYQYIPKNGGVCKAGCGKYWPSGGYYYDYDRYYEEGEELKHPR